MGKKGILTVVSGFSGAGKDTVKDALLKKYSDLYAVSVSATTRDPRPGEKDRVDYFFVGEDKFLDMISKDAFYEHAVYQGNHYGTPKDYVDEQLEKGKDVILIIEVQGGMQIRERFPDAVLVFLTPPSAKDLKERLIGRKTEEKDKIAGRLRRAAEESEYMDRYDYVLVNDEVEPCAERLHQIIQSEHQKAKRNKTFIKKISDELKQMVKESEEL